MTLAAAGHPKALRLSGPLVGSGPQGGLQREEQMEPLAKGRRDGSSVSGVALRLEEPASRTRASSAPTHTDWSTRGPNDTKKSPCGHHVHTKHVEGGVDGPQQGSAGPRNENHLLRPLQEGPGADCGATQATDEHGERQLPRELMDHVKLGHVAALTVTGRLSHRPKSAG